MKTSLLAALALVITGAIVPGAFAQTEILNASYDLSRDFYAEFNPAFEAYYQNRTGRALFIGQSHGPSSKQARAVLDGLKADIVAFNQEGDIQLLVDSGWVKKNWKARLPYGASPYRTLTVFMVRQGNPKRIKSWEDLAKKGVKLVMANPRTSGNGRYAFIGAAASGHRRFKGNEKKTKLFLRKVYANAPSLLSGGLDMTSAFVERGVGDVMLTFEAEALRLMEQFPGQYECVIPRYTVSPDFPVAVVDKVVDAQGTRAVATAYVEYLFTDAGQELAAKHHYRVSSKKIAAKYTVRFPPTEIADVAGLYGPWPEVNKKFFSDGGWFDQVNAKP